MSTPDASGAGSRPHAKAAAPIGDLGCTLRSGVADAVAQLEDEHRSPGEHP